MSNVRILIAAGGTGGHVYPAIAIADALKAQEPEAEIVFVGTRDRMEWQAVPKAGYPIENVWISGFHRRLTLKNLIFPLKLVVSIIQSFTILSRFKPQVVVVCGGFVAGPVGWAAARRNIPLMLQEQNSFPGVTNRMLGKDAERVFTAFEEANRYFPEGKSETVGNPTRSTLLEVDKEKALKNFRFEAGIPTLLILGGSGGAQSINEAMAANIETLHDEFGLQIIWQCGKKYFENLKEQVEPEQYERLRLQEFLDNMDQAYAVADLVVSRAGATSCSELQLTGKASILIPSPNVAGDHQTKNAQSMVNKGASVLLEDDKAHDTLAEIVQQYIFDQSKLKAMNKAAQAMAKPDAAQHIAAEILNRARE